MFKAFKYRLYPTTNQKELIHQHFGCARFVFNYALDRKIKAYQLDKTNLSCFDIQADLPKLKKDPSTNWLKNVNSQILQVSIKNLDEAFKSFFKRKTGFPKFKSKHESRQSFQVPQSARIDWSKSKLYLPKFKSGININLHRSFIGTIKTVTISRTPTGKYFASVLVETNRLIPVKVPICENKAVGIDLGIKTFATLSDGLFFENPRYLKKSLKRLKLHQRALSRKKKSGLNRTKAKLKLALIHEKVTNQRLNFLHKTTIEIVSKYDTLCLETLNVSNMLKDHNLARSLSDVSFSKFNELIEYKAEWHGKNILRINQFEPSSKMCTCGVINKDLKLTDRKWTCNACNTTHDRDVLASNNIKRMAFQSFTLQTTAGTAESHALQTRFPVTGAGKETVSL